MRRKGPATAAGAERDYGSYSLWLDDVRADLTPRPALDGDAAFDVAIVGGGYTGLWTAYYLLVADPTLRVAVLEKEVCGFGASGRNGGWCSALFPAGRRKLEARAGREAAAAMERVMFDTVDEVGRVCAAEGIDAHFHKGGTLTLATNPAQRERAREEITSDRDWGFGPEDYAWLEADEAKARIAVPGLLGATFTPHCARIHPARLARGLARAVESRGGRIFERTPVLQLNPGALMTGAGTVRAEVVVCALEAYTTFLRGQRRGLLPLYSLMIATEPLPDDVWAAIGWEGAETLTDERPLLIYAQRTADGRIALGGRGAPYHYGSRISDDFDRDPRVFSLLERVIKSLFPPAAQAAITHRWGGAVAAPRDWFSSVGYERARGLAWGGGYVGDGVGTSNLAGRTLADLITGADSDLSRLPWVGHHSRRWAFEPLRWLEVNVALAVLERADRKEQRTGRPARSGDFLKRIAGID